jgi:DNA-binding FadR family transcriptional regulator
MPKRVSSDIEMSLRQRIEAGEWSQSLRLPNERHLAGEYGVARNTIRAAIERIHADGGVRREVGRGTFLQRSSDASLAAVTRALVGVSPADTMLVRRIIEPKTAALAATKGNLADLKAIAAAHDRAVGAEAFDTFEQSDAAFHELIFAASRNELLMGLHAILRFIRNQEQWVAIKQRSFSLERRAKYCTEHAAIVQALMRRDSDAAERAMLAHLDTVGRNLLSTH